MQFEWDSDKSEKNLRDRGFGFDLAAGIFLGPVQTAIDERRDYGEERIIAMGEVAGNVLVVVHTDRDDIRRIISARFANKKEREEWQQFAKR